MDDWFERIIFWMVFVFFIASLVFIVLLCASAPNANAGTLQLRWDAPTTDTDSLNCRHEGAGPLTGYAGTKWWAVRFKALEDTLYLGQIPAGVDSADFVFADSVTMGELLCKTVDPSGNMPCTFVSRVFVFPLPAEPVGPPPGGGGLLGEYHRGRMFSNLLATRIDSTVNFSWGLNAPMQGVPADSFCVRWTGFVNIPTTGSWTFYVTSDDGFRWWIDGILFDWWGPTFEQEITTGARTLTAGLHPVRLDYMELTQVASCHLKWAGPGVAKQIVPASALSR